MSGQIATPGGAETGGEPTPIRVLVPSRLGALGFEFRHTAISRVVVAPSAAVRKLYHPLAAYEDSEFLDEVFGRVSEFLAGARKSLEIEYDLRYSELDGFARRVLKETGRTPYGRTRTYKDVAEAAGRPEAYRLVMAILEKNPLPLIVPCHRIVPSRAGVGKWVAGTSRKKWLLRMEQESVAQVN
jgi:O-6-methylguanine DNA methyltransferase